MEFRSDTEWKKEKKAKKLHFGENDEIYFEEDNKQMKLDNYF